MGFAVLVIGVLLVLVIIRNSDDPAATPAPTATQTGEDTSQPSDQSTPLSPEQLSTARLPLPLEVPEGMEALAVRANFMRSIAAIPTPGDLVNLYRLPEPAEGEQDDEDDEDGPAAPVGDELPDPGPDAEQLLTETEVLAVTGPLPSANDGTVTLVVAVPTAEVAGVMPAANTSEVWFTLLPEAEATPTDGATTEATEDNS